MTRADGDGLEHFLSSLPGCPPVPPKLTTTLWVELQRRARARLPKNDRLRQALDSEDLAQEAFFAIANSLDKFRGETWPQFLGFAESILSRQIITGARHHGAQRRRLDRRSPLDEAPRSLEGTASAHFMNAEDRSRLQALIEALPEALREPLKMRLAGRTYEEIATALGLSVPNARQRTARAIGRLRDHWPR